MITNLRGEKKYLVGGSTITQQLVKNFFLTPKKTLRRKLAEQYMALILERRVSKDQILEMYLNDVYLGQRGSFAVHGVAEAARLFFGKDISNVTLNEAATIAGIIQSPYTWSPFTSPERCRERRNVVLRAMADEGFISRGRGTADIERADSSRPAGARGAGAVLRRLRRPVARRSSIPGVTQAHGAARASTRRSTCICSGWRRTRCATG